MGRPAFEAVGLVEDAPGVDPFRGGDAVLGRDDGVGVLDSDAVDDAEVDAPDGIRVVVEQGDDLVLEGVRQVQLLVQLAVDGPAVGRAVLEASAVAFGVLVVDVAADADGQSGVEAVLAAGLSASVAEHARAAMDDAIRDELFEGRVVLDIAAAEEPLVGGIQQGVEMAGHIEPQSLERAEVIEQAAFDHEDHFIVLIHGGMKPDVGAVGNPDVGRGGAPWRGIGVAIRARLRDSPRSPRERAAEMSDTIDTAFLLGAGLGKRLRPLTGQCPKPLVPVCNRPLVTHAMDRLIGAGVRRFLINTHHCAERYVACFPDGRYRGCPVHRRHEDILLDTGGGLRNIAGLAPGEPLLVHNGDILTDLPLDRLIAHHRASGNAVTLALRSAGGPRHIAFDPATGRIRDIRGRLGVGGRFPDYLFTGISITNPEVVARIPEGVVPIVDVWLDLIASGGPAVGGVVLDDGHWWDVGTVEQYLAVHRFLARVGAWPRVADDARVADGVALRGGAFVGGGAVIGADAALSDCVVWPGGRVAAGSRLANVVVLDGADASGEARGGVFTRSGYEPDTSLPVFIAERARARFDHLRVGDIQVERLDKGGSDRGFFVVRHGPGDALVALHYVGEQAEENARYVAVARLLRAAGIRAPRILGHDAENGLVWMEFLGGTDLWSVRQSDRASAAALYRDALGQAALLHARGDAHRDALGGTALHDAFDEPLYLWEQRYFAEHCLRGVFGVADEVARAFLADDGPRALAAELAARPRSLIHRDFQSQNIMVRDGMTYLIDFQGARAGHPLYDVASLLHDPYAGLDDAERSDLLGHYLDVAARLGVPAPADVSRDYRLCAAQRLMQALGAYGFLGLTKGRRSFLRHIDPALRSLAAIVPDIPELRALDKVLPALIECQPEQ